MIIRKAIIAASIATGALANANECVSVYVPTLSILAICEPAISWYHPAYCTLCALKMGKPHVGFEDHR